MTTLSSHTILLILSIMFVQSCSKNSSSPTNFKMSLGANIENELELDGGIILSGTNGNDEFSAGLTPGQANSFSLELPDGEWSFKAVGWMNDGNGMMTGESRCGHTSATIDNEDTVVNLDLSTSQCFDGTIGSATSQDIMQGDPGYFKTLNLSSCLSLNSVSSGVTCGGTSNQKIPGVSTAVRMVYGGHSNFNSEVPKLKSSCFEHPAFSDLFADLSDGNIPTMLRLPFGGNQKLAWQLEGFEAKGCKEKNATYQILDGLKGNLGLGRKIDDSLSESITMNFADNYLGLSNSIFAQLSQGDIVPHLDCAPDCYPAANYDAFDNAHFQRETLKFNIWYALGNSRAINPDTINGPNSAIPSKRDTGDLFNVRKLLLGPIGALFYQQGMTTRAKLCDPSWYGSFSDSINGRDLTIQYEAPGLSSYHPGFAPNPGRKFERKITLVLENDSPKSFYFNCTGADSGVGAYETSDQKDPDRVEALRIYWDSTIIGEETVEFDFMEKNSSGDPIWREYLLFNASPAYAFDSYLLNADPLASNGERIVAKSDGVDLFVQGSTQLIDSTSSKFVTKTDDEKYDLITDTSYGVVPSQTVGPPFNTNILPDYSMKAFTSGENKFLNFPCPANFVHVKGNPVFGTDNFCVMKYEARNSSGTATSQTADTPWVFINASDAKAKCQYLGAAYDLISNPEWMTIARDIEGVDSNWSSGSSGLGQLARGHTDSSSASPLGVSNPADPYSDTGNNSGQIPGSGSEQKRTLKLSTGEEIWDFSGNVAEWVDWRMTGTFNTGPMNCTKVWQEFPSVICNNFDKNLDLLPKNKMLDSRNSVGQFYGGFGGVASRGGNWYDGQFGGAFSLKLTSTPTITNIETGFRCVYRP